MGELVNVTVADHLATIRLDRPPMNAVNTRMQVELSEAAAYVGRVPQVRAAVVYGGPNVFAGGADVKEMADKAHLDMQAFTSVCRRLSPPSPRSPNQLWPRSPDTRSAAASNSHCAPISGCAAKARSSDSQRSSWESSPAPVAPSDCPGSSDPPG